MIQVLLVSLHVAQIILRSVFDKVNQTLEIKFFLYSMHTFKVMKKHSKQINHAL